MMSLKDLFDKTKKEVVYEFYKKIVKNYKKYKSVTKAVMYNEILNSYYEDPEIILRMSSVEEISILKSLVFEEEIVKNDGYIEYLLFENLKKNFLIMEDDKFYIPEDLINYVKMALNMYDAKEHSFKDVTDSVLLGLTRIYNCLEINEYTNMLAKYFINILPHDLKVYIAANPKIKNKISLIKYKKKEYIISLEYFQYKSVLELSKDYYKYPEYSLESVISIGKYKINLFNKFFLFNR